MNFLGVIKRALCQKFVKLLKLDDHNTQLTKSLTFHTNKRHFRPSLFYYQNTPDLIKTYWRAKYPIYKVISSAKNNTQFLVTTIIDDLY